jgi:hypothetical protein
MHVQDQDMITTIQDEDLGPLKMQNLIFRMRLRPARFGTVPPAGPAKLMADNRMQLTVTG